MSNPEKTLGFLSSFSGMTVRLEEPGTRIEVADGHYETVDDTSAVFHRDKVHVTQRVYDMLKAASGEVKHAS